MIDKSRFGRRLWLMTQFPPHVILQKMVERGKQRFRRRFGPRYLPTGELSDAAFLSALKPQFAAPAAFLHQLDTRTEPRFFIHPSRQADTTQGVTANFAAAIPAAIEQANQACEHIFDLLGSGPVFLGQPIDWHSDFKVNKQWPLDYYGRLKYLDLEQPYDPKVPWELSRCQHFTALGQACWYTGNEKYAREFVSQVESWLAANPLYYGINWVVAMDVAIRAVNWLWGYHFFAASPSLTPEFRLRFFKSLLQHGRFIWQHLEWGFVTTNHYLANLVGLAFLGLLLPEFKEAKQWRDWAFTHLWRELDSQVHPDGVDFEASTSYHGMVTEFFLHAAALGQINGLDIPPPSLARLEKMVEFIQAYTRPDGQAPVIGDADDGRLVKLDTLSQLSAGLDHRHLLAIGAVLFNRPDFARAAGDRRQDAYWLFGPLVSEKKETLLRDSPPPLASQAFPYGGIYVMRHHEAYLLIDAGDNGQKGTGAHAHNDVFSFELAIGDVPFIIDPGTYTYTASPQWRNRFRSTGSHNTVMVDHAEQQHFAERQLFLISNDARPRVNRWRSTEQYDFFGATHFGYQRLPAPVTHQRTIFFDKTVPFWLLVDQLTGAGTHTGDLYFHFAPLPLAADEANPLIISTQRAQGPNLILLPLRGDGLSVTLEEGWLSLSYGVKQPAPVVKYSQTGPLPLTFATVIIPQHGKTPVIDTAVLQNALEKILAQKDNNDFFDG